MALSAKTLRDQLARLKPLMENVPLETLRRGQDRIGDLMRVPDRRQVIVKNHPFDRFSAAWVIPRDVRREGVVLYLHGGGYTCGGMSYALGFGTRLASQCGVNVFCAAYRLAPEHPFPAALEDALEAYRYLLGKGYAPERISLTGESAGGGLCYSLCLKLKQLGLPLPGSIAAISPWVDLTASGESCLTGEASDVTLSRQRLDFFARCYASDLRDPLVSPLFGDLEGMPPSILYAGGDELLLSDARQLHQALLDRGCSARLVVRPERWHGYLLYDLEEDRQDMALLGEFYSRHLAREHKLRWMRLDNAAKIYPASRSQSWSNMFRLSATLKEPVDAAVLQSSLDVTVRRFPSIAARLRRGAFWYYLQQLSQAPEIREEQCCPLIRMSKADVRSCAFRVIVFEKRIAVEFFHALTDGNGGLVFLKSLLAEYLQQKHGILVPAEEGVLGRMESPRPEELEDSFQKYAGPVKASRRDTDAWSPRGTREKDGFRYLTCFRLDSAQVLRAAHDHGVTLTAFLCAAMMMALQQMQRAQVPDRRRRKAIRVLLPVNLRRIFPSVTLRNFALYIIPQIDPRLGDFTLEEICRIVHHKMGMEINEKYMSTMIATNVGSERMLPVKLLPLPVKNLVMKLVFNAVGERKSCLSLSNLGQVKLPGVMMEYVERMDFILGVQATKPHNCGVLSFGDSLYINFIRDIREPDLEENFFRVLRDLGLRVEVQSNGG